MLGAIDYFLAATVSLPDVRGGPSILVIDDRERWPAQRTLYMSAHPAEVLMEYGLTKVSEAIAAPSRTSTQWPPR